MRYKNFILPLLLFALTPDLYPADAPLKVIKGVIDLREINNPDKFHLYLNGDWEFYWQKMLRPHDFVYSNPKPDYYGKVPSYWTEYPQDSVSTSQFGYATYRATVLLPAHMVKSLAFDLPVFDTSYDIYINGTYYGGNGVPGKTAEETIPAYRKNFFRYEPKSDTLTIIINVANFSHRRGGFWLPVEVGTFNEVQKKITRQWAASWSVISLLMGFSIFFLFFYIFSPKDRITAFFSLATLSLALRPFFTSDFLLLNFVEINWEWIIKLEYLDLFMILITWSWVAFFLYPGKFFRIYAASITIIFSIISISVIILPVSIFAYSIKIYYPSMLILMVYVTAKSFIGAIRRNPSDSADSAYFFAFLLLLAGGIHDIRVSLGLAKTAPGYLLTYFVVVFVFIQALLLLYKWINAFKEKEKLQEKMEFMNLNLEQLVNERTKEIQLRNLEIENQNRKIELQNKQLSDTIQLKNRIFSVIAHDLRSPVVNILYMLNLLKEKEYKEKYDTFANSSIQYAQLVISLLENMLVWGRGQEDKIKFSPCKYDLTETILTNLSIFKETADMKEIVVNFTQVGNSTGFFDKDLFDIIIRNLLSNAVKYTPRGGRISILLKNKSKTGEGILLKICDNGIGIPLKKQLYLFTASEIESTPGTEDEKGTGLGLNLCHDLIKINNGNITIESKEGEGTCFLLTVPVA
jgi:signal transduction histidine kinase